MTAVTGCQNSERKSTLVSLHFSQDGVLQVWTGNQATIITIMLVVSKVNWNLWEKDAQNISHQRFVLIIHCIIKIELHFSVATLHCYMSAVTCSLPRVINFKFPLSPTRNIASHSLENLSFHSFLRWKIIILTNSYYLVHIFCLKGWRNVLFELGSNTRAKFSGYFQRVKLYLVLISLVAETVWMFWFILPLPLFLSPVLC